MRNLKDHNTNTTLNLAVKTGDYFLVISTLANDWVSCSMPHLHVSTAEFTRNKPSYVFSYVQHIAPGQAHIRVTINAV